MKTVQAALLIKASLCRMSDLYIGMAACGLHSTADIAVCLGAS